MVVLKFMELFGCWSHKILSAQKIRLIPYINIFFVAELKFKFN